MFHFSASAALLTTSAAARPVAARTDLSLGVMVFLRSDEVSLCELKQDRSEVAFGQVPYEAIGAGRDDRGAGRLQAGVHELADGRTIRAVDQHVPVAGAGVWLVGIVEVLRQLLVALDEMQGDDPGQHGGIEELAQLSTQSVLALRTRAQAHDAQRCTAALAAAFDDAADDPTKIPEARDVLL